MDAQVGEFLDYLSISLCSTLCLCISSLGYFVTPSKKDQSTHILFFLLLGHNLICELCLDYSKLLG